MVVIGRALEFEWNKGNIGKNKKHGVGDNESEEPFSDKNKVIYKDQFHSQSEERFIILGRTKGKKLLYIAFTMRKKKVRIISARPINKKEVKLYSRLK